MAGGVKLPEGFVYRDEFITPDEERQLLALLERLDFRPVTMRGKTARRTVRHFGFHYDYTARRLVPADPLPSPMQWLRHRCAALMDAEPDNLAQILISRYPPGAGIGWHTDAPMFGSQIAGVSLLGTSRMRLKRSADGTIALDLAPRSAYVLGGEARWSWQHSIAPTKELRYSFTFRTVGDDYDSG